ncbi:C2H2 finger domain transcription factor mtfA-like isoform X38 [Haliotis rubra]|uniref:C2H2 finger domain transcription factor mtfA-like isoform X38 n=1 Tax=Haliotis rubra TaxID=36100 RepID=UPI001EE54443|nr:C2H2 finger domain transcription factor mtfA-like isoform X38 [Haliotis rubra]
MFIETLEFTIPVELCNVFSSLQKGPTSNVEFPASVNSYGTTQDANVQVVLRSNKLTFKVDGVSSNASMISKSECKTLKLSVFDVDRTLMPQENDNDNYNSNNMSTIQTVQQTVYLSHPAKRLHESSVSMPQPAAKSSRTSFSESPRPRSPVHRRPHSQISSSPSNHSHQSKPKNDTPVNVKQEPEDPDLIEIEPDHDPDDVVPKKETPYMQIDYSSDVPHTQTSKAALDRLSHPQSSHSQSPGSSSSSFYQNVPHVPDYAEPSTSQARYGDQSADDFLVFQDENDDGDDNEADYSNDEFHDVLASVRGYEGGYFQPTLGGSEGYYASRSRWQCEQCGKTFTSPQTKKHHIEAQHENVTHSCVCGKVYRYPRNLRRHKKDCDVVNDGFQGH